MMTENFKERIISAHNSQESHPRESGDPEILTKTLDSRFRGNDETFLPDNFEKIQRIKSNFNHSVDTYDSHCTVQNAVCDEAIELLIKYSNSFNCIADFACGTGESTKNLIENVNYRKCYAVDFSEKLLNTAKGKLDHQVEFILSDFDHSLFDDDHLDLVFCNMGLQWSINIANTIKLFSHYLSNNGLMLFSVPLEGNFPEIKELYKLKSLSQQQIVKALEAADLSLIEYKQQIYKQRFLDSYGALRSIKNVGANYNMRLSKKISVGLSRSHIKELFVNPNIPTLTYEIGVFLAKKNNI